MQYTVSGRRSYRVINCRLDSVDNRESPGVKHFCGGSGLVDRALITVGFPEHLLVDVDLRRNSALVQFDQSNWGTSALAETNTATATFDGALVATEDVVGPPRWYLERIGFWYGACGPAACWAGGAEGLVEYAALHLRGDPHSLAHFGAMQASAWALRCYLDSAGMKLTLLPTLQPKQEFWR